MAYNLGPLITILQQILDPQQTLWILDQSNPQLESLLAKAASLEQILEKTSLTNIESLEAQIRDAAHEAEDIIESYMVDRMQSYMDRMLSSPEFYMIDRMFSSTESYLDDRMLSSPEGDEFEGAASLIFSPPDLQQVIQKLDSAMERVVQLTEERTMRPADSSCSSSSGVSFLPDPSRKSVVVGADEDLSQLKDRLTGMQRKLQVVPIVGMGGIGKTTLARKLYQDPLIVDHFNYLAWSTISQDYNIREILLSLLRCIIGKEHSEKGSDELKDTFYRSLYGKKYMIVLDDIWSIKFWDEMRMYFPDNNNGSRIVITTRESDVAQYADSQSLQHQVRLLSKSDSWNLLRQIVFGEEDCPDLLLQGIGEKIAIDCGGLPLAIIVIGGLLSKVERSKYVWENIANNIRAAIAESGEQISNTLSLSYNHLPNHLKPCFLYMGAFPEDYMVKGSRLIRMWIAEGFVKSNGDKSLEEEAEGYLKALLERNLLLVSDYKCNGKPKRYNIHDLLRDLCIRKANEEKFLHVVKNGPQLTFSNPRRVSVHTSSDMDDVCASAEFMPLARSLICVGSIGYHDEIPSDAFVALRLLRVLDIMDMSLVEFPQEIFEFVNLRYLAFSCRSALPRGISRLWNLQTLIAMLYWIDVPSEIGELSELRHLKVNGRIWFEDEDMKKAVQRKLQTFCCLLSRRSINNKNLFETMQNIKKLGINYEDVPFSSVDLSHLHKLETLKCQLVCRPEDCRAIDTPTFPCNLKKLTLMYWAMSPVVLTALSELSNLEVLILVGCAFESDVWEAADEDVFGSLQFLRLYRVRKLVHWRADETNFPRLRHLVLYDCPKLEEIPSGIGDISTLQLIELRECSPSVVTSAKQIQEEQQSEYGNYHLKLRLGSKWV